MKFSGLTIGVPKEILAREKRVAVTPDVAKKFVDNGAKFDRGHAEKVPSFLTRLRRCRSRGVSSAQGSIQANLILKVKERSSIMIWEA